MKNLSLPLHRIRRRLRHRPFRRPFDPALVLYLSFIEGSGDHMSDESIEGNHGTWTPETWTEGKIGPAPLFDGVDDNIDLADPAGLSAHSTVSVVLWIKTSAPTQVKYFFNHQKDDANRIGLYLSGSKFRAVLNLAAVTHVLDSTTTVLADTWYHLVYIVDASAAGHKLYVNTVEEDTENYGHSWSDIGTAVYTAIGAYKAVQYFSGIIAEVRIYSRALEAHEIDALYRATV